MNEDKENGFVEHLVSWLKERLESPFITSFILSWLLINRDFVIFLIFNESVTKSELLSSWDFTKPSDFFGLSVSGSSYIRTLVLPAMYALIFSTLINPISLMVGAIRYWFSSFAKNVAETAKEYHDNSKSWSKIKSKISKKTHEFNELSNRHLNLNKKYLELQEKFKKEENVLEGFKLSKVYGFMVEAMKIRLDPLFDKNNLVKASVFSSKSIIDFDFNKKNRVLYADEFMAFLIDLNEIEYAYGLASELNNLFANNSNEITRFSGEYSMFINSINDIKSI